MPPVAPPCPPSNVLMMTNMVTREELADPAEYADIKLDIEEELAKHGTVTLCAIPKPVSCSASLDCPCCNMIFINTSTSAFAVYVWPHHRVLRRTLWLGWSLWNLQTLGLLKGLTLRSTVACSLPARLW